MIGSTRCPSYARAVRGLYNHDRSPPPAYKFETKGTTTRQQQLARIDQFNIVFVDRFLEAMKHAITDSFASWFSLNIQEQQQSTQNNNEEEKEEEEDENDSVNIIPTYRVV